MSKKTIWTIRHRPFVMGGRVDSAVSTEVKIIEEKQIGKGFYGFSFKTPKGTLKIAESITGAIVGDSFEEVISDIKNAPLKIIKQQIEDVKRELKKGCQRLSNQDFFKLYTY